MTCRIFVVILLLTQYYFKGSLHYIKGFLFLVFALSYNIYVNKFRVLNIAHMFTLFSKNSSGEMLIFFIAVLGKSHLWIPRTQNCFTNKNATE